MAVTFGKRVPTTGARRKNRIVNQGQPSPGEEIHPRPVAETSDGQRRHGGWGRLVVPILAGFLAYSVLGDRPTSEPSKVKTAPTNSAGVEGNCGDDQLEAAQGMISLYGYKCDPVTSCNQSSWDGNYDVTCNAYKYKYRIEDRGGNWTVVLR